MLYNRKNLCFKVSYIHIKHWMLEMDCAEPRAKPSSDFLASTKGGRCFQNILQVVKHDGKHQANFWRQIKISDFMSTAKGKEHHQNILQVVYNVSEQTWKAIFKSWSRPRCHSADIGIQKSPTAYSILNCIKYSNVLEILISPTFNILDLSFYVICA